MAGGPLARAVQPASLVHRRTGEAGRRPRRKPAGAQRSGALQWLVGAGLLSRAVPYGVIGVLAAAIACGAGRVGLTARAVVSGRVAISSSRVLSHMTRRARSGSTERWARRHHQAWGPWLLGLVGTGLFVFAAYSLDEVRFRRL